MKEEKPRICFSAEEACNRLEKDVPANLPSNQYKSLREAWCAAKMLHYMSLNTERFIVCLNDREADSVDINIMDCKTETLKYRIQVTEIAPQSLNVPGRANPTQEQAYTDLKNETYKLIMKAATNKEKRYSPPDKARLNLLIYFNPPLLLDDTAKPFYKTIYLDHGLDLDLPKITEALKDSDFGAIILLSSGAMSFLKGDQLCAQD